MPAINFGYVVADTFTGSGAVSGFDIWVWEYPGDVVTSVDWSITSGENGGTVYGSGTASVTDQFISTNQFGYNIDKISVSGLNVNASGTVYLNLQNAVVPSGDPVSWDENSGVGCHSAGCPSQAYENAVGTIPSEAFDVSGGGPPPPPPCFSEQPQDGFKVLYDFRDETVGSGVTIDKAGNLYGTAYTDDGNWGDWLVYRLFQKGQNWTFTSLFQFGDPSYGGPESVVTVGPEGVLYGTSALGGGIGICPQGGCGLVFSVGPQPTACLSGSCEWTETVLHRFQGDPDAADPYPDLGFDQLGNLYGTSRLGGDGGDCYLDVPGCGTVYELTPSSGGWTEKILYSFTWEGSAPQPSVLLIGNDGNLYGTTDGGGDYNYGTVYQLSPSGNGWT